MALYQIGPVADAGPNDYTPNAGSPTVHAQFVEEAVSDGDATYLQPSSAMTREAFTVDASGLPPVPEIASLTIHVAQKQSTAGAQDYEVGFTIGGTDYLGALHSLGAGAAYVETDDTWTTNPATALPWIAADLTGLVFFHMQVAQTAGLPRPHLSQCILIANAQPSRHQIAHGQGKGPDAQGTIIGCKAHPSVAPLRASASVLPPVAVPSTDSPKGEGS
jgi:hypothetical protein